MFSKSIRSVGENVKAYIAPTNFFLTFLMHRFLIIYFVEIIGVGRGAGQHFLTKLLSLSTYMTCFYL